MQADHEAEFTAWVAARQGVLLRSAYLLVADHAAAEDLLQGALFKVALRWRRLREGDPEAYLRTILYRDAVSSWRRVRREVLRPSPPELPAADRDDTEGRLALEQALAALTAKQRAVLVLRYVEDLTETQTAQVLGVSVGTVKSQHHAAVRRLRSQGSWLTYVENDGKDSG